MFVCVLCPACDQSLNTHTYTYRQQIATHKAELASGHEGEAKLEASVKEARERAGALRADVNGSAQKVCLPVCLCV